jgi:hypothetical protein
MSLKTQNIKKPKTQNKNPLPIDPNKIVSPVWEVIFLK